MKLSNLQAGLCALSLVAHAQVSVVTHHYDLARTGANTNETLLNTSNVNQNTFGKLLTMAVDGNIYAQPLYLPSVTISGTAHHVLFVATAANSAYAFDALNGTQLWHVNYGTPPTNADVNSGDIQGPIGIISTPVIDPATNTLYLVQRNKNADGTFHQFLRALDAATGNDKFGSPQEIAATLGALTFDPLIQNQRPALTLSNGTVYIAWASHGDNGNYHGWVIGYNAANVKVQQYVFSDTMGTNRALGGIWMSGQGPAVDAAGNLYFMTGNGQWDGTANFGDSFLKLTPGLTVADYFTPSNQASLSAGDADIGSSGPMLIPGTTNLIGGSKQGVLYTVNSTAMGHYSATTDNIVQEFKGLGGELHSGPVYWNSPVNGPTIYFWSAGDSGKAFAYNTSSQLTTTPLSTTVETGADGALAISANGSKAGTGILWASDSGALHAYDASNLATELWNSNQNRGRDGFGAGPKFMPPIVANGMVYIATFSNSVVAYGLLGSLPPPPPGNLLAIPGDARVSLAWNPDSGAISYDVYRGLSAGGEGATPIATAATAGGYVDTNVTNGTAYFYTVAATNGVDISAASNESSATPGTPVTGTPIYQVNSGGAAIAPFAADEFFVGGGTSPTGNVISTVGVVDPAPMAVYQTERNGTTTYTFPNLTAGSQYLVRLHFAEFFWTTTGKRLFNIAVNGSTVLTNFDIVASAGGQNKALVVPVKAVATSAGTIGIAFTSGNADQPKVSGIEVLSLGSPGVPAAPAGVTASAGIGQVSLSWSASAGASTYSVFRGTAAGAESSVAIAANLTATNFVDSGLFNGTTYYYFVKASNSVGSSAASNEVSATPSAPAVPAAPTNVAASAGNAQVSLSWTASSGAASYNVYRGTAASAENTTPVASNIAGTGYLDTGLINGTTYYYTVAAVGAAGISGMSKEVSATPQQSSGTSVAIYQINSGGAAVSSFAADTFFQGGGTSATNATINTSAANAAPMAVYQTDRYGGAFTYTLPGLTPGLIYGVRLHFAETYWTAAGKREFNVAINGNSVLTNFDIFSSAGGADIAVVKDFVATANSTGQIVIAYTKGAVDQAKSNGIEILSNGNPIPLPAAPSALTSTPGNGQVFLTWASGSGPVGTYEVFRGTAPGVEGATPIGSGLTAAHFIDTQVTNLTAYYYVIKAVNSSGTSAASNEASSTPGAPVTGTPVYQVNAGGGAVAPFAADEFSTGGRMSGGGTAINTSGVVSPAPAAVYQTERSGGTFNYAFPNLTPGATYLVRLHFAEFYWKSAGQRIFNVAINGTPVLQNFDIIATAGAPNTALIEAFTAVADTKGMITVTYSPGPADQPKASGIEIYH